MSNFYFFPKRFDNASSPVKRGIWRVEAAVIGSALSSFRCLPQGVGRMLVGRVVATFGGSTSRAARVRENLNMAFPEASADRIESLTRATFRHLGVAMTELATVDKIWRNRHQRLEFVERPGAATPAADHRTVFVTAHVGAWELTPLIGPHYAVDVPIIYAPERNPYVDQKLERFRAGYGARLVANKGGVRPLMRALDDGASVGLTADTRLDAGDAVSFFGEDAPTNTTPARLALRYGCEMVPVHAERLPGGRYRIHIFPPVKAGASCATTAERAKDMTTQLNGLFEQWIRQTPGEWLCMKRRWPKSVYRRHGIR